MMAFRMHRDYDSDLDTSDDEEVGVVTRADTLRAFLVNQNRRSDLPYSANPEEQIIERRGRRQIPRTPVRKSPRKRPSSVLEGSEYAEGAPPAHRFRTQEASEVPLIPILMQEKEKEVAPKFVSDVVEGVGERSVNETEAAPKRLKIPPPAPQQSPFTKCLRGLMLSPPRPTNRTMSSLRKRLLLSPSDSTEDSYFSSSSSILNSSTNSGGGASTSSTKQSTSSFKKYHYYSPISHNLRSSDTPPLELFDDSGVDMSSPIMSSTMVAITPEDAKLQQMQQQQLHMSHHEFDNMSVKSMSSAASSVNSKSSKASINRARRRFRF